MFEIIARPTIHVRCTYLSNAVRTNVDLAIIYYTSFKNAEAAHKIIIINKCT